MFDNFVLNTYDDIKPYLDDLLARELTTKEDTLLWLKDMDSLQKSITEDVAWRTIRHSCDTADKTYKDAYMYFIQEISPKLSEKDDLLNKKLVNAADISSIEASDEAFFILLRGVRKSIEMFKEENIPLDTQIAEKAKEFGETAGAMSIEYEGQTLTLQQASKHLESPDVVVRKDVYEKIWNRRVEDSEKLDTLLTDLIALRNKVAHNAGYPSYVEYRRDELKRFDYSQQDVFNFHAGVKQHIVPLMLQRNEEKKKKLGVETLQPYNLFVDEKGLPPLKPFENEEELIERGIRCLYALDPVFGDTLQTMKKMNHLDLTSRNNKRPGGYMMSLPKSKYPFVFMNAANTQGDVETLVHELGHASHDILSSDIPYEFFRNYTMEIAEVASMSMELLTMNFRDRFYTNSEDLQRAKREQIEGSIGLLPWISIIDSFQYRLYKNPDHTITQRDEKFSSLLAEYMPWVDYSDYEKFAAKRWQAQLHIFEVPFYYIEYGIAQLGAIGVWKNYIADPKSGLEKYMKALSLGYTKKLPELYATAGIPFDFSPERIKELAEFVWSEREKLMKE